MKPLDSILSSTMIRCMLPLAGLIVSQALHAATWQATVGAESDDLGRQGWAFLPNELWFMPATASLGRLPATNPIP